jgi:hypothetical protein
MSDNDTVRLGLDFQRMLRINHMLYIAARSAFHSSSPPITNTTGAPADGVSQLVTISSQSERAVCHYKPNPNKNRNLSLKDTR